MYVALFACLKIKILNNVKFHYISFDCAVEHRSETQEAMWLILCFILKEVVYGSLLKALLASFCFYILLI